MAARKGLGKGLGALITEKEPEKSSDNVSRETLLNINLIEPNALQPRKKFDEDALTELSESIKMHGLIQPIVVQKKGERYGLGSLANTSCFGNHPHPLRRQKAPRPAR